MNIALPTLLVTLSGLAAPPQVHDPRLELTLFASDPQIVTPIGLAIDARDRIYVIESHTHNPPRNYRGPKSDRIKVFEDRDTDGRADGFTVFASGFTNAMNLAFAPDGSLLVICSHSIERLRDANADGAADERQRIVELKTSNNYSHSALLGITVARDGWIYFSRGNNGSAAYTLVGSEGSTVSGYGDGGNIARCRADGSSLEEFATGFWNPFDLKFDSHGRLLCVDNDPDARGPNRLLHIVRGGDYGYRSIHGGTGNHPFQGWDGELAGTLPMVDGTGEAPSGLLDASQTSLPPDYAGAQLITIWGENRITRHKTFPHGSTLRATNSVLISGPSDFRPVAITSDSKGRVYFSDWVLVDYPNHGRGRLWRLASKVPGMTPKPAGLPEELPNGRIDSTDPFRFHSAVLDLAEHPGKARALVDSPSPQARLGALLALRAASVADAPDLLRRALRDPSFEVRQLAMRWIGEAGLTNLRPSLDASITESNLPPANFESYLAAIECLDLRFIEAFQRRGSDKANQLRRSLPQGFLEEIVADSSRPPHLRALALTRLPDANDPARLPLLRKLLSSEQTFLRVEAVRSFAWIPAGSTDLEKLALDRTQPEYVRAEAIAALSWHAPPESESFKALLHDPSPAVRKEAARLYRTEPEPPARPASLDEWLEALSREPGDAAAGARLFFSGRTMCAQCHTVQHRGGRLGPDLSALAQSVSREQVLRSILRPSDQFPPQYQAWFIRTKDGEIHEGLQLDHRGNGDLELLMRSGEFELFRARDIEAYGTSPRSLMPDGLENTMTVAEMRDLLQFLAP